MRPSKSFALMTVLPSMPASLMEKVPAFAEIGAIRAITAIARQADSFIFRLPSFPQSRVGSTIRESRLASECTLLYSNARRKTARFRSTKSKLQPLLTERAHDTHHAPRSATGV